MPVARLAQVAERRWLFYFALKKIFSQKNKSKTREQRTEPRTECGGI
jgi:hypothetical protein